MSSRRVREKLREAKIARDVSLIKSRRERETNEALDSMTKAQLVEYAEENGIKIDKTAKKAEILEKVR